jgi:putative nucleotidyltransferase-like protein
MRSEDQLCLLLARGKLSPEAQESARELLASPLRWDFLLDRAQNHGLIPFFFRNLQTLGFPGVPDSVRTELKSAFQANALRNDVLARELAHVLGRLAEAGVPVIPLKGIPLADWLYGDPALRVCADIDILVPPSSVLGARRVILANGYSSPFPESFFLNHQFHTSADCSLLPRQSIVPYMLEVHWKVLHHSSGDNEAMQDLWAEARPKSCLGAPAYALSPDWEFLYLTVHAASHKWQTLKWLLDIHELSITGLVNWQKLRENAGRLGVGPLVEITLGICSSLFATPVPPGFSPRPLPAGIHIFPVAAPAFEAQHGWRIFYPSLLKRPSDKLRWLAEMLFVARLADHRFFHLPARLSFLYYFLRPLRLTCKWSWLLVSAGFQRLRHQLLTRTRASWTGRPKKGEQGNGDLT